MLIPIEEKFFFSHDINANPHNSGKRNHLHYHNHFEVYFITEGSCTYFINNKSYRMREGDVILIPEGVMHMTRYGESMHSRMLINCPMHYIPASVRQSLPSMMYLYRNPAIVARLNSLFRQIEKEFTNPDRFSEEILCCYTQELFFLLARNKNDCKTEGGGNAYVEHAIDYVQENFTSDVSLGQVSKMCSVSPEHFSRMFKKETGFGFNKYVNLLRLQKADMMLRQLPKIQIIDLASRCGFADSNYFSVKFKEVYGLSPKELQKKLQNM